MVDAVILNYMHIHQPSATKELALLFAGDDMLTGMTMARVQPSLNIITQGFESVGLRMRRQGRQSSW